MDLKAHFSRLSFKLTVILVLCSWLLMGNNPVSIEKNKYWKGVNIQSVNLKGPFLVKDITAGSDSTFVDEWAATKNKYFFTVGSALWVSDGTATGTYELLNMGVKNLAASDNLLFFTDSGENQLWRSDGTISGTWMVVDISQVYGVNCIPGCVQNIIAMNDWAYFGSTDGGYISGSVGWEVWYSPLGFGWGPIDIRPGREDSRPLLLKVIGDTLYIRADDGITGNELWAIRGTLATRVTDIYPGENDSNPYVLDSFRGDIYFTANDGIHGEELWKYQPGDGGVSLVKDINEFVTCNDQSLYPGSGSLPCSSHIFPAAGTETDIFFVADDGVHGRELWKSDGTELGTQVVIDLNPQNTCDQWGYYPGSGIYPCGSYIFRLVGVNNQAYFTASDWGVSPFFEYVWRSDGTPSGTYVIREFSAGGPSMLSWDYIYRFQDYIFYTFISDNGPIEVWKTNTINQHTEKIFQGSGVVLPALASDKGNNLFFWGDDTEHGLELWVYHPSIYSIFLPITNRH